MRVACLVLVMLLIAPIGQSSGEENEEKWSLENKQIMHTYSISVQHAFARVSDLSSYDDYQLSRANSWLGKYDKAIMQLKKCIDSGEKFDDQIMIADAKIYLS